ncbi:MAG TPA: hypothetical protein VMF57_13830 [Solirubrobacteraceae bacterium]|nr:hypothetical protein [Solirubrobacteraceae bacterium]
MRAGVGQSVGKLVEYDSLRRRLWILGQRCHHGATGSVLAVAACLALISDPLPVEKPVVAPSSALALAAGALLMVHDWKDRSIWFERGRGSQL